MAGLINRQLPDRVHQLASALYAGTLLDDEGDPIPAADIVTLTLKLYVVDSTLAVINSVDNVSILNTGRGTVHATSGLLQIQLGGADNPIVTAGRTQERHAMLIKITYDTSKTGSWVVAFSVYDLDYIP